MATTAPTSITVSDLIEFRSIDNVRRHKFVLVFAGGAIANGNDSGYVFLEGTPTRGRIIGYSISSTSQNFAFFLYAEDAGVSSPPTVSEFFTLAGINTSVYNYSLSLLYAGVDLNDGLSGIYLRVTNSDGAHPTAGITITLDIVPM